ncbi:hypothetical protein NB11A_17700 [Ligilactobacillus agilis]|nr:hypothetical protein NB11A_17700 [Ligilactobacillus agilis]
MFRDKSNKDLKFAIRKKKNGGGAASFIIGSVVLGGLMVSGITNASADTTTTPDSTSASTTIAASSSATDKNEVTLNSTATPATASSEETSAAETTTAAPASEVTPDSSVATTATDTSASSATATSEEAPVEEGKVVVKYVDESGNQVGMPKLLAGNVGESYDTTAVELPAGYALAGSTSIENATGTYTKAPITVTYTVKKISNTEAATQALDRVAAVPTDQLATNKVSISNVHFNKSVVKESQGLDIDYAYDWTGKGLVKGDTLVSEMPAAFTSITKLVETPFYSGNDEIGVLVLDYTNHKIYTRFTGEMDPNKIYNGSINIATFVDRNHFKEVENDEMVQLQMPDGTTVERPLHVTFDAAQISPQLTLVSVYANESKDNPDKSMDVKWATTINKAGIDLNEAVVYLSPDTVLGIDPEFTKLGYDREGNLIGDPSSSYKAINPEYDGNALYKINKDSIEVYEANIHDSMGYEVTKKLVAGTDYKLVEDSSSPNDYVIEFIGDYVKTNKSFVITYGGRVADSSSDRAAINQAVTDSLLAYYEGPYNKYTDKYDGPFNASWSEAAITVNNSSVEGGAQDITGSVTVVHIDASTGKVLKTEDYAKTTDGQIAHDAKQGTGYVTAPEEFAGYKYTTMGYQSAPAEGIVKQGIQRVVYLYVPADKKGSVDVVHRTTDGQILADVKPVVTDVNVGTAYDTEKGNFNGYHFVGMAEDSAAADGVVSEGIKHVIYLYEKDPEIKKGSVDVKYVDRATGEVLPFDEAALTTVKDNAPAGEKYDTDKKDFAGYTFVGMTEDSAAANGSVVADKTLHVVYAYDKNPEPIVKKGSVDVKYVDRAIGEVLPFDEAALTTVKDNAPEGEGYNTVKKTFEGYTFVGLTEDSAAANGEVTKGVQHVIYVYTKNEVPEVKKGNVDVTYVTEDGKTLKATELVFKDAQAVGTDYKTEQKEFTGYHFVRMGEFSAIRDGKVTENLQHVVYVYAADPVEKKGSVDVKYVTDKGEVLEAVAPAKTADGQDATNVKVGTGYNTVEKTFEGYSFKEMDKSSDPATGVVAEGTKHVIYVYTKNEVPEVKKGNVDVTYVTEDGKTLKATELVFKDAQAVGTDYKTEQKEFNGYHYVRMGQFSAARDGEVTESLQHVVYVYATDPVEKKGSVDVKYVTDKGEILEAVAPAKTADGQDATNVKVGTDYTTEEKSFNGYHFLGMDKSSDPFTGVVAEGTKHVIYVYEKNPTPTVATDKEEEQKGSVTVTYVDKDGNPLPGGEEKTVKDNVPVGEEYTTDQKDFPGYHFVGMDKHSDPVDGKVTEETKHVIYVYEKNPTPTVATDKEEEQKGSVTVTYVDKDGNPLPGGEEKTVKHDVQVGEDYTTEEKDFPGYHFVGMDKTSDPANGKVTEGTKHVIYVYEKDPTPTVATDKSEEKKGSVDVKYVDTEGNVLEGPNSVVKDGLVGSDYNTSGKTFAGYKLIGMELGSASANGKVVEGTLHVIYLYQKVTADVPTAPTATSETPTVNKVQPSVTASVTPSAAQPKSEKQASTQVALPQTGETKQNSSMLGVIALGLAGMLGLGFKKEEKEDK